MVRSQHLNIRTDYDADDDILQGLEKKDYHGRAGSNNTPRTPDTVASTPSCDRSSSTPLGVRGSSDLRSPGISKTPLAIQETHSSFPDFITQTDRYGNSLTPSKRETDFPLVAMNAETGITEETDQQEEHPHVDTCDTLLESLRMMCCCILPEPASVDVSPKVVSPPEKSPTVHFPKQILNEDVDVPHHNIQLLPTLPREDKCYGKKCLVLDLDETLVHSSFRAVPGADFVIPVQVSWTLNIAVFNIVSSCHVWCCCVVLCCAEPDQSLSLS